MLLKCCTQYVSKFGKLSSGHNTGKGQFSFQSQRKAMQKKFSNYHTIAFISHASKVMLKILQAWLQQYMNCELLDAQAGFRKGRGIRDQIVNIRWIIKKARKFQKNIKFSKPGFSNMWTVKFLMFKLVFERQRNQRSNCQHPLDHQKSKRVPEKHLFLLYWLCQSLWLCGSQ